MQATNHTSTVPAALPQAIDAIALALTNVSANSEEQEALATIRAWAAGKQSALQVRHAADDCAWEDTPLWYPLAFLSVAIGEIGDLQQLVKPPAGGGLAPETLASIRDNIKEGLSDPEIAKCVYESGEDTAFEDTALRPERLLALTSRVRVQAERRGRKVTVAASVCAGQA